MADVPERASPFDKELTASFRNDRLGLMLLPTEQCNFRCTYCYEDFALGLMSPETVGGIKKLIDRRVQELRHLEISWFGGEPMLARSIVEDVASHASLAQERNGDLHYESSMTTNGYLLDGTAVERLAGLGVRWYQVSLDGPKQYHDHTRLRADGRGSFDRLWYNLLSIRESRAEVRVLLRIHLTPANLSVMPEFLTLVRDTFLNDPRFMVYLKRVVRMGGPNDGDMDIVGADDDPRVIGLRSFLLVSGDTDRLYEPGGVCYAARANWLVVRADGHLGKCTVALSDPANTIGRLLPDGSLRIDNSRLRPWLHGWESRDPQLTECPYQAFTGEKRAEGEDG